MPGHDGQLCRLDVNTKDMSSSIEPTPLPIKGFAQAEYRRQFDLMPDGAEHAGRDILRPMPIIKPGDFDDDRVKALLSRHLEGMHANSPPGHVFALDWSGLQKPEISFYALWEGEDLLGFGALKELEPRAGEIKSMRTADAHLRKGVAAAILDHIIAEARQRGYSRLSLETGSGPAFEPGLTLYRKYGFIDGEPFGGYEKSAFNQFLHLDLRAHPTESRRPLTEEQIRAAHVEEVKPLKGRVLIVDYDPQWPELFEREAARIRAVLAERALQIEHVGSTSVPGLAAKPVIDIVLVVADSADEAAYVPALAATGYRLHVREADWYEHRMFKGPDTDVNLHTFSAGCPEIDRMLMFRDWLRVNAMDRELYARTKLDLARREWTFVQNYADAKSAVIDGIIARAATLRPD
jgi:GrpB-like predicted nucleotidyltransferase (UPF0157 family)/GNAT superfamily N-acetyltransferase